MALPGSPHYEEDTFLMKTSPSYPPVSVTLPPQHWVCRHMYDHVQIFKGTLGSSDLGPHTCSANSLTH